MTIILPIVLAAVCLGLFSPRITYRHWSILGLWVVIVIAYNFFKHH